MILINVTPQVVGENGAVIFTDGGDCSCNVSHRDGSGTVTVRGNGCPFSARRYHVAFHGNVTNVTGAIQFGIYQNGEILPETLMSVVPATATDVLSIGAETEVSTGLGNSVISVRSLTPTVTVNTAQLIVSAVD